MGYVLLQPNCTILAVDRCRISPKRHAISCPTATLSYFCTIVTLLSSEFSPEGGANLLFSQLCKPHFSEIRALFLEHFFSPFHLLSIRFFLQPRKILSERPFLVTGQMFALWRYRRSESILSGSVGISAASVHLFFMCRSFHRYSGAHPEFSRHDSPVDHNGSPPVTALRQTTTGVVPS